VSKIKKKEVENKEKGRKENEKRNREGKKWKKLQTLAI
jgi:hypothetical protein